MHKVRGGIEEVPYCQGNQGHTDWKIHDVALIKAFPDDNSNLNSRMALKWHIASREMEEVLCCYPRLSTKLKGHTSRKIDDLDPNWTRLLGQSQLCLIIFHQEASSPENRLKRPWIITMCHKPMYCSNSDDPAICPNKENVVCMTFTTFDYIISNKSPYLGLIEWPLVEVGDTKHCLHGLTLGLTQSPLKIVIK